MTGGCETAFFKFRETRTLDEIIWNFFYFLRTIENFFGHKINLEFAKFRENKFIDFRETSNKFREIVAKFQINFVKFPQKFSIVLKN